jgi:hypothetical protein
MPVDPLTVDELGQRKPADVPELMPEQRARLRRVTTAEDRVAHLTQRVSRP